MRVGRTRSGRWNWGWIRDLPCARGAHLMQRALGRTGIGISHVRVGRTIPRPAHSGHTEDLPCARGAHSVIDMVSSLVDGSPMCAWGAPITDGLKIALMRISHVRVGRTKMGAADRVMSRGSPMCAWGALFAKMAREDAQGISHVRVGRTISCVPISHHPRDLPCARGAHTSRPAPTHQNKRVHLHNKMGECADSRTLWP